MRCPGCGFKDSRVIDSRPSGDGAQIRRRRVCPECNRRFTTYETFEEAPIVVIKKDGRREEFNRQKVLDGFVKACEKRPIPLSNLENLVDEMIAQVRERKVAEVTVQEIGEMAVNHLLDLDTIAYVRFVSVYRNFDKPEDFLREVEHLFLGNTKKSPIPIQVKRVRDTDVPLPTYAHEGDAGVDLYNAADPITIKPGERALVPTGLAVAIPAGFELQIRPRSGLAVKHGLTVVNAPGTIDSGYRGEIGVIVLNTDKKKSVTLETGERIAQAVLSRCEVIAWEQVEELTDTVRGEGGFGSTGSKENDQ